MCDSHGGKSTSCVPLVAVHKLGTDADVRHKHAGGENNDAEQRHRPVHTPLGALCGNDETKWDNYHSQLLAKFWRAINGSYRRFTLGTQRHEQVSAVEKERADDSAKYGAKVCAQIGKTSLSVQPMIRRKTID